MSKTNFCQVTPNVTTIVRSNQLAIRSAVLTLSLSVGVVGCHDPTGNQALPAGTQDPSYYNNATGALGMRNAAVYTFIQALPNFIATTALLADELTNVSTLTSSTGTSIANGGAVTDPVDERILPELPYGSVGSYASDKTYSQLQGVRVSLLQALGQLAAYDTSTKDKKILPPSVDSVLRGELYALYGYTEIQLADFFCSGIPLSTLDFQQDFTYRAGDSTAQVYRDAIAKLDTALVLSVDSARIQSLARVGLGRAYLDLGQVAAAADDVSSVPSDYQYQMSAPWLLGSGINVITMAGTVSDNEGGNGLPYLSSHDPRTADTTFAINANTIQAVVIGFPRMYIAGLNGSAPVTVASGVEARLIQAEAALQPGGAGAGSWLTLLNDLRQTALIPGTAQPQPTLLPPLSDPQTDSARIALTFRERAAWLYMTGHRQGDLRRQLRQYAQYWPGNAQLYPAGVYLGLGAGAYGTDVTAPIPAAEYLNPQFHGCLNRVP